jgi:hypothetical protein
MAMLWDRCDAAPVHRRDFTLSYHGDVAARNRLDSDTIAREITPRRS